jgi:hypothetical protein
VAVDFVGFLISYLRATRQLHCSEVPQGLSRAPCGGGLCSGIWAPVRSGERRDVGQGGPVARAILADAALAQALGWLDANVREINFGLYR